MKIEMAAMTAMFDEKHPDLPTRDQEHAYRLGKIGQHNVVVATLPNTGQYDAARVAEGLKNDFPSTKLRLLVGIGGGAPAPRENIDIRLGDVVVSEPGESTSGVVQFDRGENTPSGFKRTGVLGKPSKAVCAHIEALQADHYQRDSRIGYYVRQALEKFPKMKKDYSRPTKIPDELYEAEYTHTSESECRDCEKERLVNRSTRKDLEPQIHYGIIGSSTAIMKNGVERDRLRADMDIICIEMEAAALVDSYQCLVVRGISDYADSHKNKHWREYAAIVAAGYAKELLLSIPARAVDQNPSATGQLGSHVRRQDVEFVQVDDEDDEDDGGDDDDDNRQPQKSRLLSAPDAAESVSIKGR